jgi:hypothetical protein
MIGNMRREKCVIVFISSSGSIVVPVVTVKGKIGPLLN